VIERFLHDPQLIRRRPMPAATTVGDDFNLGHKPMLEDIPKPPGLA
jgi:hypothetical protein